MFESGHLPDLHPTKKTTIDEPAPESGVYENKPVELEGVVRSSDVNMEGEELQKGMTKNLLDEWKKKGEEDDTHKELQMINVAEDEGRIIENEPVMRTDVVRECDIHPSDELVIEKGYTKNLKEQLLSQKDKPKERKVIKLVENEEVETVFENTPVPLEGVVRADDETDDTHFERGKAKNLASYFLTRNDEVTVKKEPVRIERDNVGPTVLENEPEVLEGVVRASDPPRDEIGIKLSKGHAKNMASQWQKQNEDEAPRAVKQPIKIEMANQGPTVVENEPIELEGVVRCDTVVEDVIPGNRGRTKDIADIFMKGDEQTASAPKRPIEIEKAEGPVVLENQPAPVAEGVVRSDTYTDDVTLQKGHTKSLLRQWSTKQEENASPKRPDGKPAWVKEIEAAKESGGVYENEPVENDDVVRETDVPDCEKSQCIPDNYTASLKTMWMKKAEDEEQLNRRDRVPEVNTYRRRPRVRVVDPSQSPSS